MRNLHLVGQFQEVRVGDLDLFLVSALVQRGVVSRILDLERIHIRADTKPTFPGELDQIAAYSTERIQDLGTSISVCAFFMHSVSNVLCHGLRSNRIPRLIVYFDSSIEFAK